MLASSICLQVEAFHAALLQVRLAGLVDPQVRVVKVLRLLVSGAAYTNCDSEGCSSMMAVAPNRTSCIVVATVLCLVAAAAACAH